MKKRFASDFYQKILNEINSNLYITDVDTDEIVFMNEHMKKTFQLEDPEGKICWKTIQKGMDRHCDFCKVNQLMNKKEGEPIFWREKNTCNGRVYLYRGNLEKIGDSTYFVQNALDVSEHEQLSKEATVDELTGILNRNAGKKKLEEMLRHMEKEEIFTVVLYDINGLKWVNDTYGHMEGDRLLVFIAQAIDRILEEKDFIFRLSGDEFIIVFRDKDVTETEKWMEDFLFRLTEEKKRAGFYYDVSFSYGTAVVNAKQNLTVSDVLSIADTQMYIQKRDYHILKGQQQLREYVSREEGKTFQYNKDQLFDVLSESVEDYVFAGNLKTGEFKYSYKMMLDFGLPGQVLENAAAFWGEKVHPDDAGLFLRSNQEIADGRAEQHTIIYRVKDIKGEWVHLMCRGQMIRDAQQRPDLFAGIIRNLDKKSMNLNDELRILSDSTTDGIFKIALTKDYFLLYANDGYYAIHGYTRKQMAEEIKNHVKMMIYEEDLNYVEQMVTAAMKKQEERVIFEYRIKKRNGEIGWVHVNTGIMAFDGKSAVMMGILVEITKTKELEERLIRTEQLFSVARKHTRLNMWEYDLQKKEIIQTEESMDVHGFGRIIPDVPRSLLESGCIHPDSLGAARELYQKIEDGCPEASAVLRLRIKGKEDAYWWEKRTYKIVRWEGKRPVWAIGVSEDVTEQKEAEIRVFEEEKMRKMREVDILSSFRINMDKNILENFRSHLEERTLITAAEAGYGEVYGYILQSIANADDRKRFRTEYGEEKLRKIILDGEKIPDFEFRQKQKNGLIIWVVLNMRIMVEPETGEKILLGIIKDVDLLKRRELSLQQKARMDQISGFYNLMTVELMIEDMLTKATKDTCGMVLLDVDNFKEINWESGFLSGDKILREISGEIDKIMPSPNIKARISGDLFLIFFYNISPGENMKDTLADIRKKLCHKYKWGKEIFDITISMGAILHFSEGMTYQQMYQCARHALDAAKRNGKNQIMFYGDMENMENGMDICIVIDAQTYDIVDMNATGQIIFGINEWMNGRKKCYELLHGRSEVCPFCNRNQSEKEKKIWQCFVPRLNKTMYVQEHPMMKSGKSYRNICLKENVIREKQEKESDDILPLLERCWNQIDRGESAAAATGTFLQYIGNLSGAHRIILYEKKSFSSTLRWAQSWVEEGYAMGEPVRQDAENLEEAMRLIYPEKKLLITDEQSTGYSLVAQYYENRPVPLPVLLGAAYDEEKLSSLVLVERAEISQDEIWKFKEAVTFMRKTRHVCEIYQNYEYALMYDRRTGLLNYHSYMDYVQEANEDVYSAFGMAEVHVIDLKQYNRKYGTKAGDELLSFAAESMMEIFGKQKTFRISGARFLLLCPNMAYNHFNERYEQLARKLLQAYPGLFVMAKVWAQNAISIENLQYQVEEKLQVALTKIRSLDLGDSAQTLGELHKELQESLRKGVYCTYLQPKADVKTGEICGAEALVRYQDEQKGIISPGRFLPPIERAGLIRYIDLFVLQDVCRMIRGWMDKGWKIIPVSLNYSRTTILEPGILEETNRIVESSHIPKEYIEIEVTESVSSIDQKSLKDIVDQFVQAGYKITLDDFGAEYSNIYVLYSLHLHALKLDRRIISDIYHDAKARVVVGNLISICKSLGIVCVAEGVETEEQNCVLQKMGCDMIQGYYLNKPIAEEEFICQYMMEE